MKKGKPKIKSYDSKEVGAFLRNAALATLRLEGQEIPPARFITLKSYANGVVKALKEHVDSGLLTPIELACALSAASFAVFEGRDD